VKHLHAVGLFVLGLAAAGAFSGAVIADVTTSTSTSTDVTTTAPTTTATTTTVPTNVLPQGVRVAGVRVGGLAPAQAVDAVREAFVRVAYYASPAGRTRQLAIADSAPVPAGRPETVAVPIDPPTGAVAYRVRVLARLRAGPERSADGAVTAVIRLATGALRPAGSLASRLLD